ncbi:SEFIR domain-containing protein [Bradyrhizobium sp. SHOUNA76]|uniref:SEFIR domain-containing protein n=1 Tax=Bradyrhizobium sp. SHOUNA76 TaxID=2908927 RepID=UPI001FF46F39|nr:SEFIR domain-containing protein [Bradyrhizobium sp. SHOUNA76]MCJ9701718.1 TIR domain-containing protein [Bradyrhizobium sp. SHOUNA76]
MDKEKTSPPRAFVSYSWSSPDHERWVIDLATQLVESGVDVVLDKWNLREGNDAYKFMESMVTDAEVTKVIIVCDKRYAEKADGRKGGVGTESQIMSPEIYKKADQSKFTAVVSEVDENGEPYLPKFLGSRIYIDMTPDLYGTNFEQLLRWIYNKPLYVKPALGAMPAFLAEDSSPSSTRSKARQSVEIIRRSAGNPAASINSYLDTLVDVLKTEFKLAPTAPGAFPQTVLDNIERFLPYRNEYIEFVASAAPKSDPDLIKTLQRFFERIIPLMDKPEDVHSWSEWDFDNYVFIVHELFLYTLAALLKYERFSDASDLIGQRFYVPDDRRDEPMKSFQIIRRYMRSLDSKQQELRRVSLRADLLEQRSHVVSTIKFTDVMLADFVLFLRAGIEGGRWWPETLLYTTFRFRPPFEPFARSQSKAYFDQFCPVLGIADKRQLESLSEELLKDGGRYLPRWQFETLDIPALSNLPKLATQP